MKKKKKLKLSPTGRINVLTQEAHALLLVRTRCRDIKRLSDAREERPLIRKEAKRLLAAREELGHLIRKEPKRQRQ